jgi:hypothetical protein
MLYITHEDMHVYILHAYVFKSRNALMENQTENMPI